MHGHCPKCQNDKAQEWLEKQQNFLLPVPYFMLTFTLPAALRPLARSHQTLVYDLLFRASAAATQLLAQDPRFVGGQLGLIGILHTWGRNLSYHPHIHYLVPAGGLSADHRTWLPAHHHFLLPVKALSKIFRAKFQHALQKSGLANDIPASVWKQDWVVHCKPVGNGADLPNAEIALLADAAGEQTFRRGEVVFREGEPVGSVYFVVRGALRRIAGASVSGTSVPAREWAVSGSSRATRTARRSRRGRHPHPRARSRPVFEVFEDRFAILHHILRETSRVVIDQYRAPLSPAEIIPDGRRWPRDAGPRPRGADLLPARDASFRSGINALAEVGGR